MISYKEYQMLMETVTPTVNLGVTTPNAIGGVGNSFGFAPVDATEEAEDLLASLEEAKKKMFGDEMIDPKDAPPKDSDDDAEENAKKDSSDSDDDSDDKECMKKKSKKEEVGDEEANLEEMKKCGKMKKMCGDEDKGKSNIMDMLKDKSKGDDDSDDDSDDDDSDDDEEMMMKKKSKKENAEFFQSLAGQLKPPSRSNKDGISEYLEDAIFTPNNANSSLDNEPGPGEVGFAPSGRVGQIGSYEVGSEEQQALSTNFLSDWEEIKDLALGVRENGLADG